MQVSVVGPESLTCNQPNLHPADEAGLQTTSEEVVPRATFDERQRKRSLIEERDRQEQRE